MAVLQDITVGKYIATGSIIHRLDPRTKFVGAILLLSVLFVVEGTSPDRRQFGPLLPFALFLAAAIPLSRLPYILVLRNLRPFLWLFAFTILLWSLWVPNPPYNVLWRLPWVDLFVTAEGLRGGLFFSLRLSLIVLAASLLTLTTAPMDLTWGLERLLAPFRRLGLPASELAMMITIALRFVPVLMEEAEKLRRAQLARGADFAGGPQRRIRQLLPLLVPLFISAFDRADRLAVAMESRCYRGGDKRTRYRVYRFGAAAAVGAVLVAVVVGQVQHTPRRRQL